MASMSSGWVGEPDGRGTWGLIQTCLLTLLLCIYTAVHISIKPHQSRTRSLLRRIGNSVLASAVPELMLVLAISQWQFAKMLQSQLNNLEEVVSSVVLRFPPCC